MPDLRENVRTHGVCSICGVCIEDDNDDPCLCICSNLETSVLLEVINELKLRVDELETRVEYLEVRDRF